MGQAQTKDEYIPSNQIQRNSPNLHHHMKRNSMDGNQQQPQLVNNPYAQPEIKRPSIPQIKYKGSK
jgi:hypothetical protein